MFLAISSNQPLTTRSVETGAKKTKTQSRFPYHQIADELNMIESNASKHMEALRKKIGAKNNMQARDKFSVQLKTTVIAVIKRLLLL